MLPNRPAIARLLAGTFVIAAIAAAPSGTSADIDMPYSPCRCDINGDHTVGLEDVPLLASDYFMNGYRVRSDFNADGVLDLIDVIWMARALGTRNCP